MLTLYGMGSPNILKVVLALEELGLDYEARHVAVVAGEQFEPAFQALNPFGKVPVLVDGETVLFESGAILIYLAEREGRLLPASGPARYEVIKWLMAQMASVGPILGQLNHLSMMPADLAPYALDRFRNAGMRIYRALEGRAASSPWMGGADYSIADAAIWPWVRYLTGHGLKWEDYPALGAWRAKVAERPATAKAEAAMARFAPADVSSGQTATTEQFDRFFDRSRPGPKPDYSFLQR